MRVLSLCDGLGGGFLALQELGYDFAPTGNHEYYAVEIDKHARFVADTNLHWIKREEDDVTKINRAWLRKHGPFDLVLFGSPCFTAGAKVLTDNGYLPIEEIKVGDKVLTHKGRFRKVLKVGGKIAPVRLVKITGHKEIITTDEHPFLATRINDSGDTWVNAEDLNKETYCKHAFIDKEVTNDLEIDRPLAWLMGRYIADGHLRKSKRTEKGREDDYLYQIILSIGSHKLDIVKEKLSSFNFSCYPHSKSVHRVVISSKKLVDLFLQNGFKNGAALKEIPSFIFLLPAELQKEFLEGYLSGDGSVDKQSNFSCNSVSENLILGIQLLVRNVYRTKANYNFFKRPLTTTIENRVVNQKDTHQLRFKKSISAKARYITKESNIYSPVSKNIGLNIEAPVFNLEVEEDNTYTVNNVIVHNCQSLSNLGKRTGLEGKSKIFLDCVRVLRLAQSFNPNLKFLIENVKMKEKFKLEFDSYLGVKGVLVNSNLVAPQNRERYYWANFPLEAPKRVSFPIRKVLMPQGQGVEHTYALNYSSSTRYIDEAGRVFSNPTPSRKVRTDRRAYFTHKANTLVTGFGCANNKSGTMVVEVKQLGKSKPKEPGYGVLLYHESKDFTELVWKALECMEYDFIVRHLTVRECARLQTIPDSFSFEVISENQAYKVIGNGWTIAVITELLRGRV